MAVWGLVVNVVVKNVAQLFKKKKDREFGLGIGDYKHMTSVRSGIANASKGYSVLNDPEYLVDLGGMRNSADTKPAVSNVSGLGTPTPFAVSSLLSKIEKRSVTSSDNRPDPERSLVVVSGVILSILILVYVNAR